MKTFGLLILFTSGLTDLLLFLFWAREGFDVLAACAGSLVILSLLTAILWLRFNH